MQDAASKAKDAATDAKTGAAQTAESAKGMAAKAGDKISETATYVMDKAKEAVGAGWVCQPAPSAYGLSTCMRLQR